MSKKYYTTPGMEHLPFSTAIQAGDYIYLSGNAATTDNQGNPLTTITQQTNQIIQNIKQTLNHYNATLDDIIKVTIYLKHQKHWNQMNQTYKTHFKNNKPTRTTTITNLALPEFLLEITCTAYKPQTTNTQQNPPQQQNK